MRKKYEGTVGGIIIKDTVKNAHPSETSRKLCDDMKEKYKDVFEKEGRLSGKSDAVYRKFCAERKKYKKSNFNYCV